jgi:predicted amidohydrolase YtcJ
MEKMRGEKPDLNMYHPEKIITPETGLEGKQNVVVAVDPKEGIIVFKGTRDEAQQWLNSDEGKKYQNVSTEEGGAMMPGFADAHNHPILWGLFDNAKDLSEIETHEEVMENIKNEVQMDESGLPMTFLGLRTERVGNASREGIDKVSGDCPVLVVDPSFHGGWLNSAGVAELKKLLQGEEIDKMAGEFDEHTGRVTEEFIIRAFEISTPSVEALAESAEERIEGWLSQGITTLHDMEMTTLPQFEAFLLTKMKYEEKRGTGSFPIERYFVSPYVLNQMLASGGKVIKSLEGSGLWKPEMFPGLGMKLLSDGSLGSYTAMLSEKYVDKNTLGQWAMQTQRMNEAIKLALENRIENIAFHAIGDEGIKRVLETVAEWQKAVPLSRESVNWRIEHFELPNQDLIKQTKEIGAWVCAQPNFLEDGPDYIEKLGENRIRMICPHRRILDAGVPMMFGSDSMPTSALHGIWMATHAVEESQRLTFMEALTAYTIMAQKYAKKEGKSMTVGQKADIIVIDPKDLDLMGGPAARNLSELKEGIKQSRAVYETLQTLKTIAGGRVVHRK